VEAGRSWQGAQVLRIVGENNAPAWQTKGRAVA
jgi:hypothetical protein